MPSERVKYLSKLVQMPYSEDSEHMPSGRVHLRIESMLLFACTSLGGLLLATRSIRAEALVAFVIGYGFSMLFLSPDLDLARSRASRRWGIGRVLWWPYAALFKHRGKSHHPILGSLTRILYLLLLLCLIGAAVVTLLGAQISLALPKPDVFVGSVLGLYIPNLTHIAADWLVSAWKAKRARKRL